MTTAPDAAYWDDLADVWLAAGAQPLWRRHHDAVNERLLDRWLPPRPASVLKTDLFDEAVGRGLFPYLAERAGRVVGIDISEEVVTAAGAHYPALEAVRADVRQLPFADETFDAILSNSTLDHFFSRDEIDVALRELHRVLRPGGELIVTLDNPANPLLMARRAIPRRVYESLWRNHGELAARVAPSYLAATCGIGGLRRLVSASGFAVVDSSATVHAPRALAVVVADALGRHGERHELFLKLLMGFEGLARWPTRYVTGHFVAVRALRL